MHGFSDLTSATSVTFFFFHGYEQWNGYSKPVSHCQIQIAVKNFFFLRRGIKETQATAMFLSMFLFLSLFCSFFSLP